MPMLSPRGCGSCGWSTGATSIGRKIGFTNRNMWAGVRRLRADLGRHLRHDRTLDRARRPGRRDASAGAEDRAGNRARPRRRADTGDEPGRDRRNDRLDRARFRGRAVDLSRLAIQGCRLHRRWRAAWGAFRGPRRAVGKRRSRRTCGNALRPDESRFTGTTKQSTRASAANVLDGPIQALAHLVEVLGRDPHNPPLRAGEMVTTGTLTRAFPVRRGERWSTRIEGVDLPGLAVEIG